jgi:hypothetical protein
MAFQAILFLKLAKRAEPYGAPKTAQDKTEKAQHEAGKNLGNQGSSARRLRGSITYGVTYSLIKVSP